MIKKSKPKDNFANSSNVVCVIPLQGTDGKFSVEENFQENSESDDPEVRIALIGPNFKKWFGKLVEPAMPGRVIEGADITKSLYDRNILSVKGRPILMAEIFATLRDCPSALIANGYENGHTNLFYAKDACRKLRVISINVLPVGLSIESYSIGLMKWLFGSRFFRPAKLSAKKVA